MLETTKLEDVVEGIWKNSLLYRLKGMKFYDGQKICNPHSRSHWSQIHTNRKYCSVMTIKRLEDGIVSSSGTSASKKIYVNVRCLTTCLYTEYCCIGWDPVQSGTHIRVLLVNELPWSWRQQTYTFRTHRHDNLKPHAYWNNCNQL
jgi:hypothetical protein